MIFAVFDPSPLTVCINCSFKKHLLNILIALVAKPQSNSQARKNRWWAWPQVHIWAWLQSCCGRVLCCDVNSTLRFVNLLRNFVQSVYVLGSVDSLDGNA